MLTIKIARSNKVNSITISIQSSYVCTSGNELLVALGSTVIRWHVNQESCAMAKMTARCALYK